MAREELSQDLVRRALRRDGRWRLLRDAYVRLRYADGFSHARALGLMLCLAIVPFMIALTGLAVSLGARSGGGVVADTMLALTPGASEELVNDVLPPVDGQPAGSGSDDDESEESEESEGDDVPGEDAGEFALALGLLTGMIALVQAMAQIERGANRIYGVERDRPALRKYTRATVLALVAGLPALTGFLILVAGAAIGDSMRRRFHWGAAADLLWQVGRFPVSLALTVLAVAVLFRHAPRRRQPALSWLVPGAALATGLWWLVSVLLAWYVRGSDAFGATYGALTGMIALLLWANLTGVALLVGLAFTAQLEASRVGAPQPAHRDRWHAATEIPAEPARRPAAPGLKTGAQPEAGPDSKTGADPDAPVRAAPGRPAAAMDEELKA
jgi:YihY family inner membrane protein